MEATKTLYEYGRIKDCGQPFKECRIPELWQSSKNGTYALLATRLPCKKPGLNKTNLWSEIQESVRHEAGDEPAASEQGGPSLIFQLCISV